MHFQSRATDAVRFPTLLLAVLPLAACRDGSVPLAPPPVAADVETASDQGLMGTIAFTSTGGGRFLQIFTMNPDGSDITQLTTDSGSHLHPSWSPNWHQIAFERIYDIFVINADGTGLTQVTHNGPVTSSAQPAWSPDGRRLAFASGDRGRLYGISVMNSDGTEVTPLTTPVFAYDAVQSSDYSPAWSPNGKQLAFVRVSRDGITSDICVMNADGSEVTQLTHNASGVVVSRPAWSPNGKRLVFSANSELDGSYTNSARVFTINPDGSDVVEFTIGIIPAWSPNGRQIVFDGSNGIAVMGADGSGIRQVANFFAIDLTWTAPPLNL